jgi:hypothetical protein
MKHPSKEETPMSITTPATRRELRAAERAAERAATAYLPVAAPYVADELLGPVGTSYVAPIDDVFVAPPTSSILAPILPQTIDSVDAGPIEPTSAPASEVAPEPVREETKKTTNGRSYGGSYIPTAEVNLLDPAFGRGPWEQQEYPDVDDLFSYPDPEAPAGLHPGPQYDDDTATEEPSLISSGSGKAKRAQADDKGINLLALIGIVTAVTSGAFAFVPMFTFMALPIAGLAFLFAFVALLLRGYRKAISVIALVLAVASGGYNAYVEYGEMVWAIVSAELGTVMGLGSEQSNVAFSIAPSAIGTEETNNVSI